ncbi:glycosyltransferase 87 family protein [Corynebacterium sp. 35RC1]|nr:glycosyltransferase 87 family protein [Corynebacterium sp. 35RC1]
MLLISSLFAFWVLLRESTLPIKDSITQWLPPDLAVYVLAGRQLADGGNLYDGDFVPGLPFTYPPFAGTLFAQLAPMSDGIVTVFWQGLNFMSLVAVILLCFQHLGKRITPTVAALGVTLAVGALALDPVHGSFHYGQINLILMALVALDFLPKNRFAGIGVGLAAGLKLTPAFFGIVFLIKRRWTAAAVSFGTFLATVAIGYLTVPDAHRFWTYAIFNSSRVGEHSNPGAQSIRSLLERTFDVNSTAIWLACVLIVLAVAVWAIHLSGNMVLAMGFAGITACLISPFSWFHHWVWVIPIGVWLIVRLDNLRANLPWPLKHLSSVGIFAALILFLSPYSSAVAWRSMVYWNYADDPSNLLNLRFIGAGFLWMLGYAVAKVCVTQVKKRKSHQPL